MQHLRGKIIEQERRLIVVNEIFDILQKGTDAEAAEALARLRIGEKVEEVVHSMRERMNSAATSSRSPDTTRSA